MSDTLLISSRRHETLLEACQIPIRIYRYNKVLPIETRRSLRSRSKSDDGVILRVQHPKGHCAFQRIYITAISMHQPPRSPHNYRERPLELHLITEDERASARVCPLKRKRQFPGIATRGCDTAKGLLLLMQLLLRLCFQQLADANEEAALQYY